MTLSKLAFRFFSGKAKAKNEVQQEEEEQQEFAFLKDHPKVLELIASHADKLSDEALVKVLRQLAFWSKQKNDDISSGANSHDLMMMEWAESLLFPLTKCCVSEDNFQCPTKRFGKTEIQMPISGTIRREDFILQTKILPKATRAEFDRVWNESWTHWQEANGYIDLFALHVVSSTKSCEWLLQKDSECMQFVQELQRNGKIKHIGFSTHGTSHNVMRLINSQKFAFVNLHAHFFGDYHAEGTMNSADTDCNNSRRHGNHAAVQRALELDMGVFLISPLDKGGKVYQPSTTVAKLLGPSKLSPISFVCLHAWETLGFHTTSIGISRPADLDDALYAAYLYSRNVFQSSLQTAEQALTSRMHETLGTEWMTKGMMNLPDCEQPITRGVAMGHILWLHNLCQAFGMYDFCRERYANLETQAWNDKLSFDENLSKFPDGNMGRGYIADNIVDYETALKDHYDAKLVIQKLKEAHEWLCKKKYQTTRNDCNEAGIVPTI